MIIELLIVIKVPIESLLAISYIKRSSKEKLSKRISIKRLLKIVNYLYYLLLLLLKSLLYIYIYI